MNTSPRLFPIPAATVLAVAALVATAAAMPRAGDVEVRVCVATADSPAVWRPAVVRAGAADTVVPTPAGDVPWRAHFAASGLYAEGRPWMGPEMVLRLPRMGRMRGGPLFEMEENRFMPFAPPRHIAPEEFHAEVMVRRAYHDGVPAFEAVNPIGRGETGVYYLPFRPGCVYQILTPMVYH